MPAACLRQPQVAKLGIEAVGLALERRPGEQVGGERQARPRPAAAVTSGEPCGGLLIAVAGRQRHDLRLARALEIIEADEAFADILADRERAVVAQDHRVLVAEVGDQPLALVEVDRDAFIIVEGDVAADQHRGLGQRQQPVAMRRHRLARGRVEMHHRMRVLARHVDRRMDGEAGRVGDERRRLDRIAVDVDLDQRGGGHLLEHQIVRVEQEMMLRARECAPTNG